ncbi:MAG: polysaccharide biosynthesis protein, partial [Methanophagales archaeon]|nr:polysaccharide biosynthesis protein [Methanophagales archaeon]
MAENEYESKVVLVTGGAGSIGTNLCKKLAELNAEKVILLDDLSSAY